jgi:hypothetical protein
MAKEKPASVVDEIRRELREGAKNGGGSGLPEKLFFVPKDGVKTVRFLSDFNDAVKFIMHDMWGSGAGNKGGMMPQPCLKYYGKKCPFCDGEYKGRRFTSLPWYAWTVYDYEAEAKRVMVWRASQYHPLEYLIDIYEANGTLTDRDIKIERLPIPGRRGTRYKAKPVQKEETEFEGRQSKPFSRDAIFEILRDLIRYETIDQLRKDHEREGDEDDEEDEESESPRRARSAKVRRRVDEEDEKDEEPEEEEDEDEEDEDEDDGEEEDGEEEEDDEEEERRSPRRKGRTHRGRAR